MSEKKHDYVQHMNILYEPLQTIDVPDSQYTFRAERFVPSGCLTELYQPSTEKGAVAALQLAAGAGVTETGPIWLELGRPRVVSTKAGRLVISFGPGRATAPAQHRPAP